MAIDVSNPSHTSKRGNPNNPRPLGTYAAQMAKGGAKILRSTAKSAIGLDNQALSLLNLTDDGIEYLAKGDTEAVAVILGTIRNAMATQRHLALDILRDSLLVATQLERALNGNYDVDTQLERDGNGDK
jgi:hypothetical protein